MKVQRIKKFHKVGNLEARSNGVSTTWYSLVVPLKIKGTTMDGVVDTGAHGSVIR